MTHPNLFLVAAPRSGSTQMARWLASHPDIALPQIKEPNHYSAHEFDPDYVARHHLNDCDPDKVPRKQVQFAVVRNAQSYANLFANLSTRWRVDASTTYLSCPQAPELIHAAHPDARIILLTRNPVARAISHYGLALRTGRSRRALGAELDAELAAEMDSDAPIAARFLLRPSRQSSGVARFFDRFGADRVLHLRFEETIRDPSQTLARIGSFLAVEPQQFDLSAQGRNESVLPRFAAVNSALARCGAKTLLRRVIPAGAKPVLRQLWFDTGSRPNVDQNDLMRLRAALKDEV